jgi:hypothetical protein
VLQWADWILAKESQLPNFKVPNHWNLGGCDKNPEADGPQTSRFVGTLVFQESCNNHGTAQFTFWISEVVLLYNQWTIQFISVSVLGEVKFKSGKSWRRTIYSPVKISLFVCSLHE